MTWTTLDMNIDFLRVVIVRRHFILVHIKVQFFLIYLFIITIALHWQKYQNGGQKKYTPI